MRAAIQTRRIAQIAADIAGENIVFVSCNFPNHRNDRALTLGTQSIGGRPHRPWEPPAELWINSHAERQSLLQGQGAPIFLRSWRKPLASKMTRARRAICEVIPKESQQRW